MKKLLSIALFAVLFCSSSFSQFKIGAGINLDLDDSLFGIQGKVHNVFTEEYAGQVSFTYFFEKNNVTFWNLDLDVHYSGWELGDESSVEFTPFGGLNVSHSSQDTGVGSSLGNTEMGINIGINVTFPASDNLNIFIEPKFVLSGIDGFVIAGGVYF